MARPTQHIEVNYVNQIKTQLEMIIYLNEQIFFLFLWGEGMGMKKKKEFQSTATLITPRPRATKP